MLLRKNYHNSDREREIEAVKQETRDIQSVVKRKAAETNIEATKLKNLLSANGITFNILIATGGDRRNHGRKS